MNIGIDIKCDYIRLVLFYCIECILLWYGLNENLMVFKGFKLIFLMKKLIVIFLVFMLIKLEIKRWNVNIEFYVKILERWINFY